MYLYDYIIKIQTETLFNEGFVFYTEIRTVSTMNFPFKKTLYMDMATVLV